MCKKSLLMMLLLALFAPWAAKAQTLTVCDGTVTNNYIPLYGYWADAAQHNQMIYPASELTDMVGMSIDAMTFYISSGATGNNIGSWTIKLGETEATTLSGLDETTSLTQVYSGAMTFDATNMTMSMVFDLGYVYRGGNLLVDFTHSSASYRSVTFLGIEATGAAVYQYSSYSATVQNFLPKNTFTYSVPASCSKPTGLAAALTEGDGTVATLSWTENGSASEWQICLNGDETNLIAADRNPWQLTDLTPETAYTAKVRAYCSADDQSEWSNEVTFKPSNAIPLTVNDGTNTNGYVPIYGYYVDAITKSQFIIPAENLADMAWGTITKMTFYAGADKNWGAQFEVYMTETTETTLTELADYSTMTKVMNSATLGISGNQMVVEFDTPYQYSNGNLMIGFLQTVSGSYSSCSWYGVTAQGASMGGYGSSISQQNFLPKTTFGYLPGEAPSCMKPTNFAVSDVTARTATLSWTSEASMWQIQVNDEDPIDLRNNPYTLTGLDPETEYTVKVRANCENEDYSDWTNAVTFTTLPSCYAPTNLAFADITAYSANVSWNGEADSFEMEYATAGTGGNLTYDFEDGTLQGWTNLIVDATGGQWLHSNDNLGGYDYTNFAHSGTGFAMSYSYVDNGGGAFNTNAYLVSPNRYQIGGNATLNFWYDFANDSYPDHMEVCVATAANPTAADFTPIWSWDGAKRSNGLRSANGSRQRNNTRYQNWTEVTLDLNAYAGQNIWIAFHHVDYDMYEVWVDDVTVNTGGELDWTSVGTVTSPYLFNNLDDETTYIVRVRAYCGDENGYSAWLQGSFTTLPACMAPTGLTVSNIDKRSADLAWTSNGEETAWQICVNDDMDNLILVTGTSYTLTDLEPDQTRYTVKVRAYCDEELQSHWSNTVTFYTLIACPAPTGLAVADITTNSAVVSWTSETDVELQYAEDVWMHYDNGVYATTMGAGGTIYWGIMLPAESLTAGEPLTKVALHTTYAGEAEMNIYLGGDQPTGTPVTTVIFTMLGDGDFMEITLDTPVAIDGTENLWITFYQSGLTYPADGCTGPTDPNGRWVSLDGETWSDIADYGYDYTWMIRAGFGDASTEWVSVENPATPQTIEGLEPETSYLVRLRDVCGGIDGESVWVTTSFTTLDLCVTPENLTATDVAAYTAVINWEGFQDSYNVRYGVEGEPSVFFSEDFAREIPADWTNDETYPWTIVEGEGYIQSSNAGVSSSTSAISATARFEAAGTISFDAECKGEGSSSYYDHCDFYIDGTRMLYAGANLSTQGWLHYSFEVAAGEHTFTWSYTKDSSVNPTGDYFAIDNIVMSISNMNWAPTIERITEVPYVLTGLNKTTEYYVQVQGVCPSGLTEWSNMVTFTTTVSCWQPTQLAVTDVTPDGAVASWTANGEEEAWQIELTQLVADGDPIVTIVDANENPFTLTGLTEQTNYSVRVRANCGEVDGESEWSSAVSFTTLGFCDVPEDLMVGDITFYTATANWTGIQESYNLRYWKYEIDASISENFADEIPADFTNDGTYPWEVVNGHIQSSNAGVSSSTSAISVTATYEQDGVIEFDAECMGEGSSTYYDHCDFYIDGTRMLYAGANLNTQGWLHYSFEVAAGEHTFTWSYTKDSSVNPTGDYFAIDNVVLGYPVEPDYVIVENIADFTYTFTDLEYETYYFVQVQGKDAGCIAGTEWTDAVSFFFPLPTQTIALEAGANWCSFNVEITLNDLKAALVAAAAGSDINVITIKSQTQVAQYNPNNGRWTGRLTSLDLSKMYKITIGPSGTACEITLQGYPVNPADHPVTISQGVNWIAFPLNTEMTISTAFAGFPVNGDMVKSQQQNASYNRGRWMGQLSTLQPGKGYVYKSAATSTKTFTFPIPTNK